MESKRWPPPRATKRGRPSAMKMTKSEWRYKEMKQAMITENKEHSHDKEDSDALPKEYVARKKDTAAHGADVVP